MSGASAQTLRQLHDAIDSGALTIRVTGSISCPHDLLLPPGAEIIGDGPDAGIYFTESGGIGLTKDNSVRTLRIVTAASARSIFLRAGTPDLGTITLEDLTVVGQIGLVTRVGTEKGRVSARNVHVGFADARRFLEQPQKYGVNVLQGAFTLFNQNGSTSSRLTATLENISAGSASAPVLGSGVFVGGFGDSGGTLDIDRLTTGEVHSTGMLPFGVADFITGGVFVLFGCTVDELMNEGPVRTYGVNDMVLDNWGHVRNWVAKNAIESFGPSGIGFVNFGTVDQFRAQAPIVTRGLGARGFNQYDGTVESLQLHSIETFGDGSIGAQISKPVGTIRVDAFIRTHGGVGPSLVKGVITELAAEAFSVKPGGRVRNLIVGGDISTDGENVDAFCVDGGKVDQMSVGGQILANGKGSQPTRVENGGRAPLAEQQRLPAEQT
jgi:hypothetical protein